jgi:hypothetical protein
VVTGGVVPRSYADTENEIREELNANLAKAKALKPVDDLTTRDWTRGGQLLGNKGEQLVFDGPPSGDQTQDQKLDTGHYDDGHSFGWSNSKSAERDVWKDLTYELDAHQAMADIVVKIETHLKTDINGDGQVGTTTNTNTGTTVGPPVVTGGGP